MEETYCYVAIKKCGCVVAVCFDKDGYKKDTAKSVSRWLSKGFKVERVLTTYAKNRLSFCKCEDTKVD